MANRKPFISYKKIYLPFVTLLVLTFIFSVYLFLFVSKKEREIQQRNFRVLTRIEQNLSNRIEDTYRLALTRFSMIDSAKRRYEDPAKAAQSGGFNLIAFSDQDSFIGKWCIKTEEGEGRIYFKNDIKSNGEVLSLPVKKIITPLLRNDVFEHCMILKGEEVLYNDFSAVNEITENDSLFGSEIFFHSLSIKQIEAGKINYYAFIKPFSIKGQKDFAIIGWVTASQYNREKYTVPGNYLLGVLLVLFFMLLSFPFIKSLLMSRTETLDSIDVVATVLSLFMICYAVTYTFNEGFSYLNLDRKNQMKLLKNINDKIEKSFLAELDSIYYQMELYDRLYANNVNQKMSCSSVLDKINTENLNINDSVYPVKNLAIYPHFKYNFWLDENGNDVCNWTTDSVIPPLENYSTRNYFKNIKSQSWWFLRGNRSKPFTLETVNSWSDGSFRAVVAAPSETKTAVAMSSYMPSLINSIIPPEIEYCLIDKEGNVLIHSDLKRSLNENLFEECNNNANLRSAVFSRTNTFCKEHYMGRDTRLYISPVDNLPLFLVTINDRQFIDSINLATFVFTFFHIAIVLAVVIITILLLVFFRRRNHILQDRLFNIKWLYPSTEHSDLYRTIIVFNIVILILTYFLSQQITQCPISVGFLFCMNAFFTTVSFFYTKLKYTLWNRRLLLGISIVFLVIADLVIYDFNGNLIILIMNGIYQVVNFWFLGWINEEFKEAKIIKFFPGQLINFIKIKTTRKKENKNFDGRKKRTSVFNLYAAMLMSWLALVAILPAYRLHQLFYTEEHEVLLKFMQLKTAEKISTNFNYRKESTLPYFKLLVNNGSNKISNTYLSDYYGTALWEQEILLKTNKSEGNYFNTYANYVRIALREIETYYQRLSSPEKRDSTLRFVLYLKENEPRLQLQATNLVNSMPGFANRIIIGNKMPYYSPINANSKEWFSSQKILTAYILSVLMFFILLYAFVLFFIKRFFLVGYIPDNPDTKTLDQMKIDFRNKFLSNELRLFVTGVPSAGKNEFIKEAIIRMYEDVREEIKINRELKNGEYYAKVKSCETVKEFFKKHVVSIDLAEFCYSDETKEITGGKEEIRTKKKVTNNITKDTLLIILRYFDFGLADPVFIEKKYKLISDILKDKNRGIIMSSALHPSVYLKSLKVAIDNHSDKSEDSDAGSFKAHDYISNAVYYKWSTMLSGFYIYTHPLLKRKRHNEDNELISDRMEQNTYRGHHLGYTYYYAVWSSLPGSEKFVLYDLAEDNLANFNNREAIISLQQKGLIAVDDYPEITDDSFRNYILTEVKESDIEAEKRAGEKESAWVKFKVPFFIILAVVLFFVFTTQEDIFFKAVSALTAFMGGLSVFSKFFTGFKAGATD